MCDVHYAAAWKAENPERRRELARKKSKAHRLRNLRRIRAYDRARYRADPEATKERVDAWREKNLARIVQNSREYIARLGRGYVRKKLGVQGRVWLPEELIEAKRLEILIKRRTNQKRRA